MFLITKNIISYLFSKTLINISCLIDHPVVYKYNKCIQIICECILF